MVAFQRVDHFKRRDLIPKEDYLAPVRKAANIGRQFRPCAAQCSRQRGKLGALLLQPIDEGARDGAVSALMGKVKQDVAEILRKQDCQTNSPHLN